MIECDRFLRSNTTGVDEPSMYKHGLGTLETERSSVNHIVDMINIVMFTIETTPSHVMIGHGLVDSNHVSLR